MKNPESHSSPFASLLFSTMDTLIAMMGPVIPNMRKEVHTSNFVGYTHVHNTVVLICGAIARTSFFSQSCENIAIISKGFNITRLT